MATKYETDNWPFVKARWFTPFDKTKKRAPRVIVIHDMEAPETANTAENVARYFATLGPSVKASAHICVDNNSIVQCVKDNDIAYAAPGCNSDGIQIELSGYGKQTREQWLDQFGIAMLALGADATAQYCLKYNIPPNQLTNAQLAGGMRGIVGHYQVSEVYKKSDHTDPGRYFPWDYFLQLTRSFYNVRKAKAA